MEELLKQLLAGQNNIVDRLDKMDERFDKMDERFDNLELRLERVEGQLDENQLIRGLMHNVETLGAEVNGLKVTTLTKEAIAHLATKEDIAAIANVQQLHTEWLRKLAADSSQHEVEIHMLKQVK